MCGHICMRVDFGLLFFFPGNAIEHLTKYLGFCESCFKVMEVLPFLGGSGRSMANIYPKNLPCVNRAQMVIWLGFHRKG